MVIPDYFFTRRHFDHPVIPSVRNKDVVSAQRVLDVLLRGAYRESVSGQNLAERF
ncbi:MAG: hypothetical protein KGL39_19490 [Patescibacteria group bacterium]|nr:hypothetical protein [Patescibacteria group bacterium]